MNERNSIEVANSEDAKNDAEQQRREQLSISILEKFNNTDGVYFYKEVPTVPAFKDQGNRLTTELDNEDVAIAMTKLADSKGWTHFMTTGSEPFYAAVEDYTKTMQPQLSSEAPTVQQVTAEPAKSIKPEEAKNTVEAEADIPKKETTSDIEADAKKAALLRSVQNQYRVAGSIYYFKDQAGSTNMLAFKDVGQKLTTALNTERVTRSLVDLAESKGWGSLKVSGHSEFKRQVWREAVQRGIDVTGYKPTEIDLETVQAKAVNSVERVQSNTKSATLETVKSKEKQTDLSGELVSHGEANYKYKSDSSPSYYATVKTSQGERTIWGADLHRAIAEAGVTTGEQVSLSKTATQPVTVRDGHEAIETVKNTWAVQSLDARKQKTADRSKIILAVSDAVAVEKGVSENDRKRIAEGVRERLNATPKMPPAISMYDNQAVQSPAITPVVDSEKTRKKAPELIR